MQETGVSRVATFIKEGCQLTLSQSVSSAAVFPVIQGWGTALMNIVTEDGFCMMYPALTLIGINMINPTYMRPDNTPGNAASTLVKKYEEKGIMSYTSIDKLPIQIKSQSQKPFDPNTMRTVGDRWCLQSRFNNEVGPNVSGVVDPQWLISWKLGGWLESQKRQIGGMLECRRATTGKTDPQLKGLEPSGYWRFTDPMDLWGPELDAGTM